MRAIRNKIYMSFLIIIVGVADCAKVDAQMHKTTWDTNLIAPIAKSITMTLTGVTDSAIFYWSDSIIAGTVIDITSIVITVRQGTIVPLPIYFLANDAEGNLMTSSTMAYQQAGPAYGESLRLNIGGGYLVYSIFSLGHRYAGYTLIMQGISKISQKEIGVLARFVPLTMTVNYQLSMNSNY